MTVSKTSDELLEELAALRKSEERYRGLIENANDLVQVIGADARIRYVNAAWKKTLGYDDAELGHLTIFDIIHPDCLVQCRERFRQVLAGEAVDRIEIVMRAKDGRKIIVEGSTNCTCVGGQLDSVQGIFRDITVIRRAEESLARLRERHEVLLNSIGEGVLGIDRKGRHIFVNPAAARMLGYEAEELLGLVNHETWHHSPPGGSGSPEEECPIDVTWREGQSFHSDCEVFWRKDGTSFPVEYVSSPIREEGRIVGAVITFVDITARRQAEEHTKRLQHKLLQARKMQAIGTLAGGVAHDFNNILTAIMGNLELALLKSDPAAPNRKYLLNIRQVTERAVDLIGQLLLFSRKRPMEFVAINLNRVVGELERMLHRIIGEDVAIRLDLERDLKPICGSVTNMEQVILNMAVNARDAMPAGGTFTITTRNEVLTEEESLVLPAARPGAAVCLTIADTGTGMGPEVLQQIFEPFYSTKESGKGTGLGLAVVYGIVQEHQGWIQVESEPGRGTHFKIFIPAHGEQPVQERPPRVSLDDCQGRGERILLVEDQEEVRQIAGSALATNGYRIALAADAGEAKRIFSEEQGRFDLVFSDVVLPDQSGVDLVLELMSAGPGLKVLLSSGYIDDKSRLGVIHQRGLPFLAKPYAVTGLLQTVREVLDGSTS
jgi:two-component system, cell cycle sensor histidine kinase and response regulator CckA